ncbi:hypothetical protein CIB48_g3149 [Xylaria polymorpha]|nr:hypothetical protein CIB48_g3149 [Xylaria polymorpha]
MTDPYNYNLFQQIYCLSFATGAVGNQQDTEANIQAALKESLKKTLPKLTGNWALSWGPRIFKEEREDPAKGGPDNAWYAAVDDTQKVCVLAIAGTADNSWADIYQDFNVIEVVDFDAWVKLWSLQGIPGPETYDRLQVNDSTLPLCAKGACAGAWNVLNNASTEPNENTRIDEYLRSLDSSYTIVVAGHSLGGALAPTVALGLVKANLVGNHTVKVLASAGVSSGNKLFADEYAATFAKDPSSGEDYQVYNTDYHNVFDIVPQAWSVNREDDRNLYNILDKIVTPTEDFKPTAKLLVNAAIDLSFLSRIQYTPLPGQRFAGPPPTTPIGNDEDLGNLFATEHVFAYWDEIGIKDFMVPFSVHHKPSNT